MSLATPLKEIGLTRDAGYQFGIRRTVHASPAAVWNFIFSPTGLRIWLGEIDQLPTGIGSAFTSSDGVHGKIRAFKPGNHIRMDWQPSAGSPLALLQVRVIPSGENAIISFHLERLADDSHRQEMSRHWSGVMDQMTNHLK